MVDVVSKEARSRMMAGIRSRDTAPELVVRRLLHARGLRYRLHDRRLPGRPDIVFPRYRAALFVHGCFWHGHECSLFKWPATNPEFWQTKIRGNRERDARCQRELQAAGWRVHVVWECEVRSKTTQELASIADRVEAWLTSPQSSAESI